MADNYGMARQRTIGERMREARENARLTQEQVGDLLSWSPSRVSMYERGQRDPGVSDVAHYAEKMGLDCSWLAFGMEARDLEAKTDLRRMVHIVRMIQTIAEPTEEQMLSIVQTILVLEQDLPTPLADAQIAKLAKASI